MRFRAEFVGEPFERVDGVPLSEPRQHGELRVLRREQTRLVRIGKERHRNAAADQHDVLDAFERLERLIDRIRNAVDRDASSATLHAAVEGLPEHPASGLSRNARRKLQPLLAQRQTGEQQQCRLPAAQHPRGFLHGVFADARALRHGGHRRRSTPLVPCGIARKNERRDLPRRQHGGGDRGGAVLRDMLCVGRGAHPAGERLCGGLDVGGER